MVIYEIKLGSHTTQVPVPRDVRGLDNVAHYIADHQARQYADSVTDNTISHRASYLSWYDSHLDAITELLLDFMQKLKDRREMYAR